MTNTENFGLANIPEVDHNREFNPVILGSKETEILIGTSNSESILGFAGNDSLVGKDGDDLLFGGGGNDFLLTGRGNNLLLGHQGDDILVVSNSRQQEAGNNTLNGGAGNDVVMGGFSNDLLVGKDGDDTIMGFDGHNTIKAGAGFDEVNGGAGNDRIKGGDDTDILFGGDGNDAIFGGNDPDFISGYEGLDRLWGGAGGDVFELIPNTGEDIIVDFEDGLDLFFLSSTLRFGSNLTFDQLSITQGQGEAIIAIAETDLVLARVKGVAADALDITDFISFEEMESEFEMMSESELEQVLSYSPPFHTTNNSSPSDSVVIEEREGTTSTPESIGLVTSQAVEVLNVLEARDRFGVDGSGVKIGVISDSFDRGQFTLTTAEIDTLSGDLPGEFNPNGFNTPVEILDDLADNSFFSLRDEGRAMIQLIHDIAPGAEFIFHTGFDTPENFASGIDELVAAGADIIVDDIGFFNEPFFQDGIIAQAANRAFAAGVPYFSAAGNSDRDSYEAEFRPVEEHNLHLPGLDSERYTFHDFDPGARVDVLQNFTLDPGSFVTLSFQWDEPFASAGGAGASNDLDILILDAERNLIDLSAESNVGTEAVELIGFFNPLDEPAEFHLAIAQDQDAGGLPPNFIKYINFADGNFEVEYDTQSSTVFGHPNAAGAEAVGASFYQTPELLEDFSSGGITPIFFDSDGNRLPEPEFRQKPEIVAPDGTNNTFFGSFDVEEDGFPNFFGTSAAAPHAAGVGALLLEAHPDATPEQIYQVLEATAIDLDSPSTPEFDPGFDIDSGFGLIQADLALEALVGDLESI